MFKAGYGKEKIKEWEAANAETTKSKSSSEINFLQSWPIWYISLDIPPFQRECWLQAGSYQPLTWRILMANRVKLSHLQKSETWSEE